MRDIKFRAWHDLTKKMIPMADFGFAVTWKKALMTECFSLLTANKSKDFDVMQYTGLKDKNGVEIYEGDVVRWTNVRHWWTAVIRTLDRARASSTLYAVELKHNVTVDESGNHYTYEESDSREGARVELPFLSKTAEVIGNIYENPELMEK